MIRKCLNNDAEMLLNYLYQDKVMNLFAIGDIENFGVDTDTMSVWVDLDNDRIKTIYLKYLTNVVVSSNSDEVDQNFIQQLIDDYGHLNFNGKTSVLSQVNFPQSYNRKPCFFACLESINTAMVKDDITIQRITLENAHDYYSVQQRIFNNHFQFEDLQNNLEHPKSSRYYALYKSNEIVSIAGSTAECKGLAMIVGVGTLQQHRNNGYASAVVSKLSEDLLKEGKMPCLFYDNPQAASVYMKLGFKKVGEFTICG